MSATSRRSLLAVFAAATVAPTTLVLTLQPAEAQPASDDTIDGGTP